MRLFPSVKQSHILSFAEVHLLKEKTWSQYITSVPRRKGTKNSPIIAGTRQEQRRAEKTLKSSYSH